MKIPLEVTDDRVRFNCTINFIKYKGGLKRIIFAVDTGSPITFMNVRDAEILKVPTRKLKEADTPPRLFVTGKVKFLKAGEIRIIVKNDEGKSEAFKFDSFNIAQPISKNQQDLNRFYSTPSIMGLDFLKENNFSLHINMNKKEAYLEKIESSFNQNSINNHKTTTTKH